MNRYVLSVPDMSCAHCESRIKMVLQELGIADYTIDLPLKTITLSCPCENLDDTIKALGEAGYDAALKS